MFEYLSSSTGASMEIKLSCKERAPLEKIFFQHRESALKTHSAKVTLIPAPYKRVALQSTAQLFQVQDKSLTKTKCFTEEAIL